MAALTFTLLTFVFAIFKTLNSFAVIAQSDDMEYEIISDDELYVRQKQAFVDSLGYGSSSDDKNKLPREKDEYSTGEKKDGFR